MSNNIRFMYVRNLTKTPVGCIAYCVTRDGESSTVDFVVSFCNARDHFDSRLAREIARARFENPRSDPDAKPASKKYQFTVDSKMKFSDIVSRLLVQTNNLLGKMPRNKQVHLSARQNEKPEILARRVSLLLNKQIYSGPECLYQMVYWLNHPSGFARKILDKKIAGADLDLFV